MAKIFMKKIFIKTLAFITALLLFAGVLAGIPLKTMAASISISASADTISVGDTITITVTISGNAIGAYSGRMDCDEIFSGFTGVFAEGCSSSKNVTFSYYYQAVSPGEGTISVSGVEVAVDDPAFPNDPMKMIKELAGDASCTVTVVEKGSDGGKASLFNDVKDPKIWYYGDVYRIAGFLSSDKTPLMGGYQDGSGNFGPDDPLTRQDFALILYRLENKPAVDKTEKPYPDADPKGYYYDSILWAKENKIITGYENGKFGVGHSITREQVATILYRYTKEYKGIDVSEAKKAARFSNFKDADEVSSFAMDALFWANGAGIIKGKDDGTRIDPQGNAARAEIAAMILRFIQYIQQ